MKLSYMYLASPVGQLKLVANAQALVAVLWENENPKRVRLAELLGSLICRWILKARIFSRKFGRRC